MKLVDYTIDTFAEELASASPAPGGGSAAALCGTLGAALTSMVANLTVGREKFKDAEETMQSVLSQADALRSDFLALIDEDTEAFNGYMAAWKLPKATDEEKCARKQAIDTAAVAAADVPLRTLETCAALAKLAKAAAESGNPNVLSDAGVAALLAVAAAKSAAFNVRINLPSLKDEAFANECRIRMEKALEKTEAFAKETEGMLDQALPR